MQEGELMCLLLCVCVCAPEKALLESKKPASSVSAASNINVSKVSKVFG